MGHPAVLVLLGLVVVLAGVGILVVADRVLGRTRPVPLDDTHPGLRGAWGITERSRALGILVALAVAAACLALAPRWYGLTAVLAPALAALACLVVLLAGQRVIGRRLADGGAGLEVRSLRQYAGRAIRRVVGLGALLVALAVAGGGWYGSYGRQFDAWGSTVTGRPREYCDTTISPFLGPYYALPLAGALAAVGLTVLVVLRVVVARPRNGADPGVVAVDDEARRRVATSALAVTGVAAWGTLAIALTNFWSTARTLDDATRTPGACGMPLGASVVAYGVGAVVAAVLAVGFLVRLLRPSAGRVVAGQVAPAAGERVGA